MGSKRSVTVMTPVRHSYQVSSLGNYATTLPTKTSLIVACEEAIKKYDAFMVCMLSVDLQNSKLCNPNSKTY